MGTECGPCSPYDSKLDKIPERTAQRMGDDEKPYAEHPNRLGDLDERHEGLPSDLAATTTCPRERSVVDSAVPGYFFNADK